MFFLISFICFFNVRATDAMPFFAITVILTYLTDCYLKIMAKEIPSYLVIFTLTKFCLFNIPNCKSLKFKYNNFYNLI